MAPIYINWEKVDEKVPSNEKIIKKIKEINDCSNSNDIKFFIQVLKNQEVLRVIRERKAKGESNIKTFTIIYLSEYENSKFKRPIDTKLFIIPSKENKLKELELVYM